MVHKALVCLLVLCLPLASPGSVGWLAFAEQVGGQYRVAEQPKTSPNLPPAAQELLRKLQNPALAAKLSPEEREQAIRLLQKYPDVAADPETAASLRQIAADLDDSSKEPAYELHTIFDKYQNGARAQDEANTVVSVLDQSEGSQTLAVHDLATGRLLFTQRSEDIGSRISRRTIIRHDPSTGQKVIDAIVEVDDNDAAGAQRVVYNRKVQEFLRTLKKFYYDQCPLVRKINNGDQPPRLSGTGCVNEGGTHDDKVGAKAIADMRKVYEDQQHKFQSEMVYTDSQGRENRSAMNYLKELDAAKASNSLDKLDWRDLMAVQRAAMRFYSANELVTLQKYVLIQLTSFLSQITNSQPKGDKEGVQDASLKENAALQKELDEIEKGHLQDYDMVMGAAIRAAHLSAQDQKFIPKSLYDATGEAFAYLGYAVKTNVTHAFAPGVSGEEQDATVEEAQHWIKLAQIQLQTFEASSLAIQMERLKAGELSQHLGLTDDASKAQALKLAKTAREVYLPGLAQESLETKSLLLKQAYANFFQTIQNAQHAHLMTENLRERLRTLAAKAEEIHYLYLAREFERFKTRPEFQVQTTALDRLENAPAFSLFLKKIAARQGLDPELEAVAASAAEIQYAADFFKKLSEDPHVGEAALDLGIEQIRKWAGDHISTTKELDDESKKLGVKWAHFNQAYQTFSSQIRMFDMVNELDLYVRRYMSSEMVSSESQGVGSAVASMKWMDKFYNKMNLGHRDDIAYFGMKHSPLASGREAWEKLVANKDTRKQILGLMNKGDFNAAMELMAKLDPAAAERAAKEAAADKAEKDPFESLDFEASLVSQPESDLAIRAQGAVVGVFQSLQAGILTYMAAAGVMDMVTTTLLTAGIGQFAKAFGALARATAAGADALEGMKAVKGAEGLSLMARAYNIMLSLGKGVLGYTSRMLTAWGNNAKNIAAAKEVATGRMALKQVMTSSLIQAATRTIKTTATIAGASVVMSVGQHEIEKAVGGESQFRDASDAALQGAVGGLSFGGKAGLLFMFSPIQSTAMGGGAVGRIMTGIAETPGPISGLSSFAAKVVPEWAEGTVAKQGLLGKLAESAMEKSEARQLATRTAVFGGGMLDGMLKFTLIAEVPKWVVEGGSMFGPSAFSKVKSLIGMGSPEGAEAAQGRETGEDGFGPHDGTTAYMRKLTGAQNLGANVAQMSWLVLPMQAMQGTTEDMHKQMDQMYGFNRALAQGKGLEFEGSPNDVGKVGFRRPWYYRLFNRENPFKQTGRKGEVDVRSEFKKMAVKSRLEKASLADVVANAQARPETMAGVRDASVLIDALAGGKTSAPASVSARDSMADMVGTALDEIGGKDGKGKLYAYFDAAGNLEKVTFKPENGRVDVEFDVTREGVAQLSHEADGKLSRANVAAARELGPEAFQRAQDAFHQAVADAHANVKVTASGAQKPAETSQKVSLRSDQYFVTNESVEAAGQVLDDRLAASPELRQQLLRAKADPLELLSRDAQAREKVLRVSGETLELRDDQTGFAFELKGEALKKLKQALGKAGGDVAKMLETDPRMATELRDSKDISSTFVLRDPKTGESVKLGGKAVEDLRYLAEWHKLNTRPMSLGSIARSAIFGDEGGHSPFEGRIWKIITGRTLNSKSQILTAELQAAARDQLETMADETPGQRMAALERRVAALRGQMPAGDAKALEPLHEALAKGDLTAAKKELLALSGGVEPSRLLSLKRSLSRDGPAPKKVAESLKTVKGWGSAEAAAKLDAALSKGEPDRAVDAALGVIDEVAKGHTLETLDNVALRLDGRIAADDIIETVHEEMDRRISAATGEQKLAMEDLRGTLESDAFLRLANDKAVEAVGDFKVGDPASQARLEEAKRLLVGTWERGVFGQKYAVRVEKTDPVTGKKTMVWEVPSEQQFRDVNDNLIPSFRQHQRDAIEQDLDLLASGKKRMYDLMKTSGGKTLLGFVLVSFLEKYAQSRGREGVFYVTTDAGLVAQTRDNYLAMFKGRKPSFEIIDYSELFLREAMAKQMGTLSPWASHDVYADELDQVGLGTPLSLGKFNGALTHTAIDPVQKVIQTYVEKAGLAPSSAKDKDGNPLVCSGLCAKYSKVFDHQRLENPKEFEAFLRGDSPEAKAHPKEFEQFRKDWSDLNAAFSKAFREAREQVESRSFLDRIPQDYADKRGMTRKQVRAELLKEYKNAFGARIVDVLRAKAPHVGVFEAKYGDNTAWLSKVLKGSYMAGTYGDKLAATYKRDPDREAIVSIVNDQALANLDTYQRTALEAREGVALTLDFENAVVVNFRNLLEAARRNDASLVAASGTQPAEEETFLQKLGVKTVGEGSPIDKVEKMPHQFIMKEDGQVPYIVSKFKELMAKQGPSRANPETGKPAKNIAVVWAPDDAVAAQLLDALKKAGVTQDRVSIRMSPGSSFFLQERYKLDFKDRMNDEGLRAGGVDVALMIGQGGFRGHEMPLQAYAGGEIKMFVMDSASLTDVGSIQLSGRIDSGRVPKSSITTFELLDDFKTVTSDRYYKSEMPRLLENAVDGRQAAQLAKLEGMLKARGMAYNEESRQELMTKPGYAEERKAYRDYLALARLRDAIGEARLSELSKLKRGDPKRSAAVQALLGDGKVASTLVIEMRRGNEKRALQSSGVSQGEGESSARPGLFDRVRQRFSGLMPGS